MSSLIIILFSAHPEFIEETYGAQRKYSSKIPQWKNSFVWGGSHWESRVRRHSWWRFVKKRKHIYVCILIFKLLFLEDLLSFLFSILLFQLSEIDAQHYLVDSHSNSIWFQLDGRLYFYKLIIKLISSNLECELSRSWLSVSWIADSKLIWHFLEAWF